jgi:hypothetical protein
MGASFYLLNSVLDIRETCHDFDDDEEHEDVTDEGRLDYDSSNSTALQRRRRLGLDALFGLAAILDLSGTLIATFDIDFPSSSRFWNQLFVEDDLLSTLTGGVKSFVFTHQNEHQRPQTSDHCPRQTKENIYGGFSPGS